MQEAECMQCIKKYFIFSTINVFNFCFLVFNTFPLWYLRDHENGHFWTITATITHKSGCFKKTKTKKQWMEKFWLVYSLYCTFIFSTSNERNWSCHSYIAQVVHIFCVKKMYFSYIYLFFTVLPSGTLDIDQTKRLRRWDEIDQTVTFDSHQMIPINVTFLLSILPMVFWNYKHRGFKLPNDYDKSMNIVEARWRVV